MAAILSAALIATFQPSYWRRTIRSAFAREVMLSGVEAIGIVGFLAIALGIFLVVQYQVWLGRVTESVMLGQLLVAVFVRELAPILVNPVVIARSGSPMAAALALLHVTGESRVAEGQGLDPLDYLVIPRVLALTLSVFCLTLIFLACSFLGEPDLLILERPTTSDYPEIMLALMANLRAARSRGAAVLWITDDWNVWNDPGIKPTIRCAMAGSQMSVLSGE